MALLRVDMVACEGIGQCALVAPGLVELDRWGFPVVRHGGAGDASAGPAARRAVRACPRRALWLEEAAPTRPASSAGSARV